MRPVVVLQDATADSDARRDETRRDKTRQDEMQSAVPRAWDRSCITVTLSTLEDWKLRRGGRSTQSLKTTWPAKPY